MTALRSTTPIVQHQQQHTGSAFGFMNRPAKRLAGRPGCVILRQEKAGGRTRGKEGYPLLKIPKENVRSSMSLCPSLSVTDRSDIRKDVPDSESVEIDTSQHCVLL